jgi:two-component system cell cycle response regulator
MADNNHDDFDDDSFDKTIVTTIEKVDLDSDEKAYILFIAGPLIGKMFLLEEESTSIGRAEQADITIADSRISRKHIILHLERGQVVLEDLGSTNGTFVNGERIAKRVLQNGDKIHISSDTFFKFALGDEAERMFQQEMHEMANYDAVTGIFNKHVFLRRIQEELSYAKRSKWNLSLLMIDIDFFKKVNDTHGHMAGDFILQGVAQRIQKMVRDEDILARYGGEEFSVILRGTTKEGARTLAERIRLEVAQTPFVFEGTSIPITISTGGATLEGNNFATPEELIAQADACLYTSKEEGRNRVTI